MVTPLSSQTQIFQQEENPSKRTKYTCALEAIQLTASQEEQDPINLLLLDPEFISRSELSQTELIEEALFPATSSSSLVQIRAFLKQEEIDLTHVRASEVWGCAQTLPLKEKKLHALYCHLLEHPQTELEDLLHHLPFYTNERPDLLPIVDQSLAKKLKELEIALHYKEEPLFRQLVMILDLFWTRKNSHVHKLFRKEFSPLVIAEVEQGTLEEKLAQLAPPIELTITPDNFHLLDNPIIYRQLKQCTLHLHQETEFYLRVLEKLPDSALKNLCVQDEDFLEKLQTHHKDSEYVVRAAVRKNGNQLQFASKKLQARKAVVLDAVVQNPQAIRFAHPQYASDSLFLKEVCDLRQDEQVLEHVSKSVRNRLKHKRPLSTETVEL